MKRVYVTVDCRQYATGAVKPLRIYWHDGRVWEIDSLVEYQYPKEDEFKGIRYTVVIGNKERFLYYYNEQWYVMK